MNFLVLNQIISIFLETSSFVQRNLGLSDDGFQLNKPISDVISRSKRNVFSRRNSEFNSFPLDEHSPIYNTLDYYPKRYQEVPSNFPNSKSKYNVNWIHNQWDRTGEEGSKNETTEATTEKSTTTTARYKIEDVKVPVEFLRIEYMIDYVFLGIMYGMGFFVFFQSIIVPLIKGLTFILYTWGIFNGLMKPVTKAEALAQVPPN